MTDSILLSIIIWIRRGPTVGEDIERCLSTLLQGAVPQTLAVAELLFVEDVADQDSKNLVEKLAAQSDIAIHYVPVQNSGPGLARNLAAERAQGQYLAFFDTRCQVTPAWIDAFRIAVVEKPDAAVMYGPVLSDAPPIYPFIHSCQLQDNPVRSVNIVFERSFFDALGGYDPTLSYWAFEWDMIERAKQMACRMVYVDGMSIGYPPTYQSPEYFNFSKLMRIVERSGYLMKKHPRSEAITHNFLLFRFQAAHFFIRLLPLGLLWVTSPLKTLLIFLFWNVVLDATRLIVLQLQLMRARFNIRESDAVQYLLWNWSLDVGLFLRQLLLIPYRFC
jgi:glycosyltransferase involved in cell wall biosynthesis